MLTFLDHAGREFGTLSTFKTTNAVNGERSISGTIYGGLGVERGWKLRHEDEYYAVIYAKPKNTGRTIEIEFDAVHQFFWDFDKSSIYTEMDDGTHSFEEYLDFVFAGSGYRYKLEVEVKKLRKQNFGLGKRLALFNDLIKHAGVEFQVRGKVVRILEKTGTELSTVVRKKLNLNDLSIEKNIGNFVTYVRGLGAWHDDEDHSKGRLEVEYTSPLASIYGKLEAEPYIDERFTIADNFREVLKKTVEDSYSVSIQLSMEDLIKAGYNYTRPISGDYITVIDEDLGFKERVRIVSFETEYDVRGQVVDHQVTCNDIGAVKKQSVGYSILKSSVADTTKQTESAIKTANRALVAADGKTTTYFGTEFPKDVPKGSLIKGDQLYLEVGDKIVSYYWNGAEWIEPPVVNDFEKLKQDVVDEFTESDRRYQAEKQAQDRQIAEVLANTNLAKQLAEQAKTDLAQTRTNLAQLIGQANTKANQLEQSLGSVRTDVMSQAQSLLAQARAQTELTSRVATVESTANGTKATLTELSKTVTKAIGDIASVTSRTKTVEDTLSQTRTQYEALTQTVNAQTGQIDSINRKTADLQSGIDGVTERFENLQVGGENLLLNAGFEGAKDRSETFTVGGVVYTNKLMPKWGSLYNSGISNPTTSYHAIYRESFNGKGPVIEFNESNGQRNWKGINAILRTEDFVAGNYMFSADVYATGPGTKIWFGFYYYNKRGSRGFHDGQTTINITTTNSWHRVAGQIKLSDDIDTTKLMYLYIYAYNFASNSILYLTKPQLEYGTVATPFRLAQETLRSEIATYKRTADEASEELRRQIQTVDGKAVDAKNYAQQTAEGFKTRIESLETYKDGESTRASQYFTASRDETARQVSALRTAVTNDYVAKAKYEEDARGVTQRFESLQVGGRNYIRNFGFTDSSYALNNANSQWRYERIADPTSRSGYHIKATCTQAGSGGFHRPFVDLRGAHWQGRTMTYAVDVKCSRSVTIAIGAEAIESGIKNQTVSTEWQRFAVTGKVKHISTWSFVFYIRNTQWQVGDVVYIRDPQLEDGTMATTPSPAPEDQQSYADTKIAEYKTMVDGRFATIQASVDSKANQVDFQAVKETAQLYERIIGSTETGIKDKVARMVMADSLFLTEVKDKITGTATQVSQLNNSYAIKNLTSAGSVLGQINLNPDGSVRINDGLISIGDKTYIKNGVIKSAMIGNGQIGTAHIGTIDAAKANIINLNVRNIVGLDAAYIRAKIENALIGYEQKSLPLKIMQCPLILIELK